MSLIVLQVMVFSTTIYLHRGITHRAVIFNPVIAWLFRLAVWLTTGIIPREWVAVHRKHHAHTEEDGDPHSPKLLGFWKVQLGNVYYYIKEARNPETVSTFAKDLQKSDFWDKIAFNNGLLGMAVGTGLLCLTLGFWWGIFAATFAGFSYVFVLSSSINGLCHAFGYKNFDNTAGNFRSVALLTGGEGLHNNHHGHPRMAKFSVKASEIDPAWPVIRSLELMGLAKVAKATA
ncbi:MAG TPA: fatty acid desaturase [Candidatus Polarisedimenticolaceae bacterium]|nr:fatty acid desaturase [Candidatus Polarisedimenticolaceae bacterium]